MNENIREIGVEDPLDSSVKVITDSFRTVAGEFGLTVENAPTHPSFITIERLTELRDKGLWFFGYFLGDTQLGFVAVEKADDSLYYMEKLAVLPRYRHNGYGVELVKFALDFARGSGGEKLSIGIIDEHTVLKDWYKKIGFRETSTVSLPHLPFTVGFLEFEL